MDASRRDGSDDGITAVVSRFGNVGVSLYELGVSLYLFLFGVATYYFIPMTLLNGKQGLFLLIMNLIMMSMLFGLLLIMTIVLPIL